VAHVSRKNCRRVSVWGTAIGVIYGEYEGYRYPTFWTDGYRIPTFQDEKVKNLLSPAVNRSDLRRLICNETNFDRSSAPDPLRELTTLSRTPESDEEGILSPHSPPFSPRIDGRLVLLLNLYPHFLDQSYNPLSLASSLLYRKLRLLGRTCCSSYNNEDSYQLIAR